jgi:hypothetical protein
MSAIMAFLAKLLADILGMALDKQKTTGSVSHGTHELHATPVDELKEKARRSGLLGVVVLLLCGCGTTHVVVATLHPVEPQTAGWPRVAQDEVRVLLDGTDKIGVVSPAGGYFLVHEADLKGLLRAASQNK